MPSISGLGGVADPGHTVRVGRDDLAEAMRFVGRRGEDLDGVGGEPAVRAGGHAATGRHHLDPARALFLDQLPDRRAHALLALGLAVEPVAVAAPARHGAAGREDPRPEALPALDRPLDAKPGAVASAALEDGSDARADHPLSVDEAAMDELLIRFPRHRPQWIDVAGERDVDVGVHEAGEDGGVGEVDLARVLGARD